MDKVIKDIRCNACNCVHHADDYVHRRSHRNRQHERLLMPGHAVRNI